MPLRDDDFRSRVAAAAWAATRHRVYRGRDAEAERDPRWGHLQFVRLRSQAEADAFLADVSSTTMKED